MYKARIKKKHIAWTLLVLVMCFIFYTLDPSECRVFPRCPFLTLTGWECPGCGNRDQDKMNVARRTCGYIGTQFWNQGRTQEIRERVLHL